MWNPCLSQEVDKTILISVPEQDELKKDIYDQLVTKWKQTDHNGIWNENDMMNLVSSSSNPIFPEEYLERKFSKLGYQISWHRTSEPVNNSEFHLYGELGKTVKIYKGGGQSVSAYLKVFNPEGQLIAEGEPDEVYKILKKRA